MRSLPALCVLRPQSATGRVEVELAPIGEQQGARGHERLRDRVGVGDRVLLPGPAGDGVGQPGPEIDDQRPVQVDRDRRAELSALLEAARERLTYGREGLSQNPCVSRPQAAACRETLQSLLFSSR